MLDKEKAIEMLKVIKRECIKEGTKCTTCSFHKLVLEFICPFGYTPEKWEV